VVVLVDKVVDLVRVVIAVVDLVVLVEVFQISVVPDLEVVDTQAVDLVAVRLEASVADHPEASAEFPLEDSAVAPQVDSEDQDSVEVVIVAVEQPSFKNTFTSMYHHQSLRKFVHNDQFQ